jgi:hypothetical protein
MKQRLLFLLLFFILTKTSLAQYHAGIGLRLGKFGSGLTMKYFANPDNATGFELMILKTKIGKQGGWWIAPLYVYQMPFNFPLIQLPMDFVVGAGMHVGYYPKEYYKIVDGFPDYYPNHTVAVGADILIALEYQVPIKSLPFVVGIETQPFYEFIHRGPEFVDFGITVKYVFNMD